MSESLTERPLAEALLRCLDDFQAHSTKLFATISAQNAQATRQTLAELQEIDQQMAALLKLVPQHQSNQTMITDLKERIRSFDANFRKDVADAHAGRDELAALIRSGRKAQASTTVSIPSKDLLSLARQLAPFTSAPILSDADKLAGGPIPPHERALRVPGAYPPFPPEEEIRRGVLGFVSAQSGAGGELGQTGQMATVPQDEQQQRGMMGDHTQHMMMMDHHHGDRWDGGGFAAMDPAKRKELEEKERADMEAAFDLDLNPDLDD